MERSSSLLASIEAPFSPGVSSLFCWDQPTTASGEHFAQQLTHAPMSTSDALMSSVDDAMRSFERPAQLAPLRNLTSFPPPHSGALRHGGSVGPESFSRGADPNHHYQPSTPSPRSLHLSQTSPHHRHSHSLPFSLRAGDAAALMHSPSQLSSPAVDWLSNSAQRSPRPPFGTRLELAASHNSPEPVPPLEAAAAGVGDASDAVPPAHSSHDEPNERALHLQGCDEAAALNSASHMVSSSGELALGSIAASASPSALMHMLGSSFGAESDGWLDALIYDDRQHGNAWPSATGGGGGGVPGFDTSDLMTSAGSAAAAHVAHPVLQPMLHPAQQPSVSHESLPALRATALLGPLSPPAAVQSAISSALRLSQSRRSPSLSPHHAASAPRVGTHQHHYQHQHQMPPPPVLVHCCGEFGWHGDVSVAATSPAIVSPLPSCKMTLSRTSSRSMPDLPLFFTHRQGSVGAQLFHMGAAAAPVASGHNVPAAMSHMPASVDLDSGCYGDGGRLSNASGGRRVSNASGGEAHVNSHGFSMANSHHAACHPAVSAVLGTVPPPQPPQPQLPVWCTADGRYVSPEELCAEGDEAQHAQCTTSRSVSRAGSSSSSSCSSEATSGDQGDVDGRIVSGGLADMEHDGALSREVSIHHNHYHSGPCSTGPRFCTNCTQPLGRRGGGGAAAFFAISVPVAPAVCSFCGHPSDLPPPTSFWPPATPPPSISTWTLAEDSAACAACPPSPLWSPDALHLSSEHPQTHQVFSHRSIAALDNVTSTTAAAVATTPVGQHQQQQHSVNGACCSAPWPSASTLLAYDDRMLPHCAETLDSSRAAAAAGHGPHPERPDRVLAVMARLQATGLLARCQQVRGREATVAELAAVHDVELVHDVEAASARASGHRGSDKGGSTRQQFTGSFAGPAEYDEPPASPPGLSEFLDDRPSRIADCYVNAATYCAARVAAGSAADVAVAVATRRCRNGAAIVRPPGHHAETAVAMGFCYFNNAAVAARAAQQAGARKVLIMDWDIHHGNGTQHIFEDDDTVMYASIHRHDHGFFFPGTGSATEAGRGAGVGYTVNVPWDGAGACDSDYLFAFKHVIMPIASEFAPDLVIVSAGFDAADGDPLGECHVSPPMFGVMTARLGSLAPLVLLLEGGYNLAVTAACTEHCVRVMLGDAPEPLPPSPPLNGGSASWVGSSGGSSGLDAPPTALGYTGVTKALREQSKHWASAAAQWGALDAMRRPAAAAPVAAAAPLAAHVVAAGDDVLVEHHHRQWSDGGMLLD